MSSKSISKSVIWQLGGKFALQGIAFFTTPIFTRLLTPSDYGYTALYSSWLSIFSLLSGLQIGGSIGNARLEYGEKKLPEYLSSIMTVSLSSFIVFFVVSCLFHNHLEKVMGISSCLVILLSVQSFCAFLINFEVTRLDQLKSVEKSTVLSLCQAILVIILSLIFIITTKGSKAEAKIYGQSLPTILFGMVIFFLVYKRGKIIWNSKYIKFCLSLTLPLVVHGIGHLIFSQSDRIMLQKMHGEDLLGIYSVTFNLCAVLSIIYSATNVAWVPFYMDFKKQGKEDEILLHSKRYLKFFTLISVGFVLLSYDVYKIMAPIEYYEGMKIIPLFVLSNFFSFIYLFPVNFEFYKRKTKLIPLATLFASLINIVINFMLIPKYGLVGAAIGTAISHVILFLFHELVARLIIKDFEFPWHIYILSIIIIFFTCVLAVALKNMLGIRWVIFIIVTFYLLKDLFEKKSVF